MAGILFKAYFRVSLGGPEKEVVVEELGRRHTESM